MTGLSVSPLRTQLHRDAYAFPCEGTRGYGTKYGTNFRRGRVSEFLRTEQEISTIPSFPLPLSNSSRCPGGFRRERDRPGAALTPAQPALALRSCTFSCWLW